MKCVCKKRARFRVRYGISIVHGETGEHECAPGTHSHWNVDGARAELALLPSPPPGLRYAVVEHSSVEVDAPPIFCRYRCLISLFLSTFILQGLENYILPKYFRHSNYSSFVSAQNRIMSFFLFPHIFYVPDLRPLGPFWVSPLRISIATPPSDI